MSADASSPLDWNRYRELKSEGRLNLLLRLSDPTAIKVSGVSLENRSPSKVLPFVSRDEHLRWRRVWQQGRFVRLTWLPKERAALLRQDAIFHEQDALWKLRHGPVEGAARVLRFVRAVTATARHAVHLM